VAEALLVVRLDDDVVGDRVDSLPEHRAAHRGVVGDDVRLRAVARLERERLSYRLAGGQGRDDARLVVAARRRYLVDRRAVVGDPDAGEYAGTDSHR